MKLLKRKTYWTLLVIIMPFLNCSSQSNFDFQGHRGCRGLMPENTIAAMKKALDLKVTTLELDVVISADSQVVVSHEPFMASDYVLEPGGNPVDKSEEKAYNLFKMTYEEIATFDVGMRKYDDFPHQKKKAVSKPLLSTLIDSVEAYARKNKFSLPRYNVEIKSTAEGDNEFHPEPEQFVALVYNVMKQKGISGRSTIQSFDVRPLQIIHEQYPHQQLAFLVNNLKSVERNIENLGFTPHVYSPYYKLVTKETVKVAHNRGIKVVPWTINDKKTMKKMIKLGVDGLISDYPDLYLSEDVQKVLKQYK